MKIKTAIVDLCFDFICVPKERWVVFSGIVDSPYQNEEIICFGIPIIFETNFNTFPGYYVHMSEKKYSQNSNVKNPDF